MKNVLKKVLMLVWGTILSACSAGGEVTLSDAGADFEGQKSAVIDYLSQLQNDGQYLAGTQVNEYEVFLRCDSMDRLVHMVGAEQAILGLELMFAKEYPPYEDYLIQHAVKHSRQGGLVTLAWHQRNPIRVCPRGEFYDCSKTPISDEELERVLTPGTPEHALWMADVDAAAKTLKRLEAEGVMVLFRPYHEMNGGWFWWGQKDAFPQLWDALVDALEKKHGLQNIVWVWSGDRRIENAERYWPERHKPDIVGSDVYERESDGPSFRDPKKNLEGLATDQPFAFTEIGLLPSQDVLRDVKPAWVFVWGGEFLNSDWKQHQSCDGCNSATDTKAFFANPNLVTLEEMPDSLRHSIANGQYTTIKERPHCPASLLEEEND